MPDTTNRGVRIHFQVEGEGPALELQHGFTSSLEVWRQFGYVQALQRDYQLIMLDSRGHGASDKPDAPAAYTLAMHVGEVVAVLDVLHIHRRTSLAIPWADGWGSAWRNMHPSACAP